MVRTYAGENQWQASQLYAEDAPKLAAEGWTPVTQAWVADEPVRTIMVTYDRPEQ